MSTSPIVPNAAAPSVVVIGNFDGVHLGHRAVVSAAVTLASATGALPRALTFHPHPREVLGRGTRPVLTRIERKRALLERLGIGVVVEPFTADLAALSPERFAREVLAERLGARVVLVGENFRFGHGRAGDFAALVQLGDTLGFEARALPLAGDELGLYSSTRVREALARGELDSAERCLGRPHSIAGTVVRGDGRGRTIGVPTANLGDVVECLPPNGVYAVLVDRELAPGETEVLGAGVANLGVRPTVGAGYAVEVHLLDFDDDLYGARLRVHFAARLRDEQRFSGLEALTAQIRSDIDAARAQLSGRIPEPSARGGWA